MSPTSVPTQPAPDEGARAERLRRANLRLAIALGLVAAALYVGFVLSGIL